MAKTSEQSSEGSGVEELVEQLKQDGVEAGRSEAERILREARAEADRIVNQARADQQAELARGKEQLELERRAVEDGLRQASRDTLLTLQTDLANRLRARVEELCEDALRDPDFLRSLLLAAVGREVPRDERLEVAATVFQPAPESAASEDVAALWLKGELAELLREGVQLRARAGAEPALHIELVEREARIDVTSRTLAELLWERMIPRFRHLLSFEE